MFERAKRVGQLVSSNVESLLDNSSDPRKMLLQMRTEIEDSLVALQGERTRAARKAQRLSTSAKAKADGAKEWTVKPKLVAMARKEERAKKWAFHNRS